MAKFKLNAGASRGWRTACTTTMRRGGVRSQTNPSRAALSSSVVAVPAFFNHCQRPSIFRSGASKMLANWTSTTAALGTDAVST